MDMQRSGALSPRGRFESLQTVADGPQGCGEIFRDLCQVAPALKAADGRHIWSFLPAINNIPVGHDADNQRATGADVLPSYDYFRIYHKDDICRVH